MQTVFGVYRYGSLNRMKIYHLMNYCVVMSLMRFFKCKCDEEYEYVIELEDGTELIAGPSHPVYVIEDDGLINKRADQLVVGDDIKYFS